MKATKNYNWETTFDTANETMTMVFSERVKAVTNFKKRTICAIKDGRVSYSFGFEEDYTIEAFERFLLNMAESAKTLEGLK
jgi:hypothetical protein